MKRAAFKEVEFAVLQVNRVYGSVCIADDGDFMARYRTRSEAVKTLRRLKDDWADDHYHRFVLAKLVVLEVALPKRRMR